MLANLPLFETHLWTTDLSRAAAFYEQVLGLRCVHGEEARGARFYYIGGQDRHMLGVWQVQPEQMETRHFAFGVTPEVLQQAIDWLKAKGVAIHNHSRTGEEPEVHAWMPAAAIYFWDPDGNHIEILARLPDAPRPDLRGIKWAEWETLHGRTLAEVRGMPEDLPLLADASIYETHVTTADPARSAAFYGGLLGLPTGMVDQRRGVQFYDLGPERMAYMLGVWPVQEGEVKRHHFAWGTTPENFPRVVAWLKEQGVVLRNFNNSGDEPLVLGWMPAVSMYFTDPDGHSLEVLAMLPDSPRPELGLVPWSEWEAMHGRSR